MRAPGTEGTGLALEDARDGRERCRGGEGVRTTDVLVEHRPECEDVRAHVDRPSIQLLGSHVRRRPNQQSGLRDEGPGDRCGLETRQAKVEDLQPPIARPYDVFRFQIAMDDAARVRLGERARDLPGRPHDLGRRRPPAGCDLVAERGAVDEFRDNEQLVVGFLERVDRADARMGERRGGPRLAPQPFALHWIACQVRSEHLERDLPSQSRIRREVHASHASAADFFDDRVRTERRSGGERGVVGEQIGHPLDNRFRQEVARASVMIQQRDDFVQNRGIAGRLPGDPRSTFA